MPSRAFDLSGAKAALQLTQDRRSSIADRADYKENQAPKATTPWDISCPEQVTQFAQDNPDDFYEWLVAITSEREDFRKYTQQLNALHTTYKELQAKVAELDDERKDLQADVAKANEKLSEWRSRSLKLQEQVDELDKAALSRTTGSKSSKKSIKLSDPPVFTDGKNPTWDEWFSQCSEKLSVNSDHFTSQNEKKAWLLSRTGGDAATHTFHRRQPNAEDPYTCPEDVFEHLRGIYADTDRLENARRSLVRLQMGDRPFKTFVADFQRFGYAAKLAEDHLIQMLREKLPPRLLKPMLAQNAMTPLTGFNELRDYLVRLDNSHSHDLPTKTKTSKSTMLKSPREAVRKTSTVETTRKPTTTRVPVCYNCGKIGHFKNERKKCPVDYQTAAGKAVEDAAVNEMFDIDEIDGIDNGSSSDSSSNSGNE